MRGEASTATGPLTGSLDLTGEEVSLRERKKQRTWLAIHESARSLILERGVDGVTIEEICEQAEVSPRTFFNYFASKAEAALGVREPSMPAAALERFAARHGEPGAVGDVCDLLASMIDLPPDPLRTKELARRRPEIAPAIHHWMSLLRTAISDAAIERLGERDGRLAVALVFAGLFESMHDAAATSTDDLAVRLRERVAAMVAIAQA
ncbi:TetR/AcrR family transcriptional regulator [Schumannella sp. 10F1B-5-1]|uniref:TetR/AcrR family transcriptional regulator n=1 Tax=Schumannella sp. 10F1B-5-1 TaxID=2590780 RepID=UPI00113089C2|nr:TetR/AcrR family transcriptional regulator [Schumannella sp. 10F1B-5-1]TPW78376.1 TetR/AcrR family transcriptional regulator [Schumannella sp. 10F1B-5-1]